MFKYEIHLHTKACSQCSEVSGFELVDEAVKQGYSGFVITNHFYHGNCNVDRNLPWEDFVEAYNKEYQVTKEYAAKKGINVLFGFEEGFAPFKEMLILGIMPEVLKACTEFLNMDVYEIADFVHKNGGILICAHPFRNRDFIPEPNKEPPAVFDFIECYNNRNALEDNRKAVAFAEKCSLPVTVGGDVHSIAEFGHTALTFPYEIKTEKELLENLKSGNYGIIKPNQN